MIHEIINPSDEYTIECDDMEILTASIFILGEGSYATESKDTDFKVPITIFGGENGEDFFKNTFGKDLGEFANANKPEIAECLETICIGSIDDRELYIMALSKIDEDQKEDFIKEWYDKKQSSMNGIGQRALLIAKAIK